MKQVFIFTQTPRAEGSACSNTGIFASRELAEKARHALILDDKKREFAYSEIDSSVLYENEEDIESLL